MILKYDGFKKLTHICFFLIGDYSSTFGNRNGEIQQSTMACWM